MALANFTDLKTAVTDWMARSDVAGKAEDFITLGEAALNRELDVVDTDTELTGTVDSREIDVSSLSVVEPRALFLIDPDTGDEAQLTPLTDGTFPYVSESQEPSFWSFEKNAEKIKFDTPLNKAYKFRFEYRERFALSDANPTNWLLTNHPDLYLAATLVWGGVFTRNAEAGARWATVLAEALPSVRNIIAQKKRGRLKVDDTLRSISRRWYYYDGTE